MEGAERTRLQISEHEPLTAQLGGGICKIRARVNQQKDAYVCTAYPDEREAICLATCSCSPGIYRSRRTRGRWGQTVS